MLQLEGYAAASNVRGTVFLKTIGIDASQLTTYIIVCCCFYLGLVSALASGEWVAGAGWAIGAVCVLLLLRIECQCQWAAGCQLRACPRAAAPPSTLHWLDHCAVLLCTPPLPIRTGSAGVCHSVPCDASPQPTAPCRPQARRRRGAGSQ